jgi:hypothetical protein
MLKNDVPNPNFVPCIQFVSRNSSTLSLKCNNIVKNKSKILAKMYFPNWGGVENCNSFFKAIKLILASTVSDDEDTED